MVILLTIQDGQQLESPVYIDTGTTWYLCIFSDQDFPWWWFEVVYRTFELLTSLRSSSADEAEMLLWKSSDQDNHLQQMQNWHKSDFEQKQGFCW